MTRQGANLRGEPERSADSAADISNIFAQTSTAIFPLHGVAQASHPLALGSAGGGFAGLCRAVSFWPCGFRSLQQLPFTPIGEPPIGLNFGRE